MHALNKMNAIVRAGNLFRATRLSGTGISPCDRPYLFYICHHEGVSQDTLRGALFVNKSSVARRLAHLEKEGFVIRTPDPNDRRVLLVSPTEKAREILPLLRDMAHEWNGIITEGFTKEDVDTFSALLSRAFENAQKTAKELVDETDL